MSTPAAHTLEQFHWEPQRAAAALVRQHVDALVKRCAPAAELARRLHAETGTRLWDFVDHVTLPAEGDLVERLASLGFKPDNHGDWTVWQHAGGLLPEIHVAGHTARRLSIKVESVADFLAAGGYDDRTPIEGPPCSPIRKVRLWADGRDEFWAVERHGSRRHDPQPITAGQIEAAIWHHECFRRRRRAFDNPEYGFAHAADLIRTAEADLGADWTCDLFFAAEREYWQRRNRAARVQKARQDLLGVGWANHDHHTYRASREHFAQLIATLELLGFVCRERFYGGRDAGWGAQVLEQPNCGIVIFADVDMSPEEVSGDFAHDGLTAADELGTVGLWCKLHGEAFLEAGLHHLECRFDFDAARKQLDEQGVRTMSPFTDLPYLKQAFTDGQFWPVEPARLEKALAQGFINKKQADEFRRSGAIGSHLEILQRDDAYKGFNQSGINEIIAETDPRRQ